MNLGLGEGRDKEQLRLQKLPSFLLGMGIARRGSSRYESYKVFSTSLKGTGRDPMASNGNKAWQESSPRK